IIDDEAAAKKQLDDQIGKLTQLEKARAERENSVMKEVTEMPILDAFGRPIKIEQIWLPKLTINYNFGAIGDIARFDRCITCHQGMDKPAPGSAVEPGYRAEKFVDVQVATPADAPEGIQNKPSDTEGLRKHYADLLLEVYGLQLFERGLFD